MIVTELYNGQGLGNQLFSYVMTRVLALDKNIPFGIMHPEKFKGASFMRLDFGKPVIGGASPYEGAPPTLLPEGIEHYYSEKRLNHISGADIRSYDEKLSAVSDNTKIDGLFQGENYFKHRKDEIREWLSVELPAPEPKTCIINFRGGEYVGGHELFLPQQYWNSAVEHMRTLHSDMVFRVVTDDVKTARKFFPGFEVSHALKDDYCAIQSAEYLILSNSSFAFFPAWLNQNAHLIIAPKYWARHNVSDGYWSCGYTIVEGWMYLDRDGTLCDYTVCTHDLEKYTKKNSNLFIEVADIFTPPPPYPLVSRIKKAVIRLFPERIQKILKKVVHTVHIKLRGHSKIPKAELEIFERLKENVTVVFDVGVRNELSFYFIKPSAHYHLFEPNTDFTKLLKKKIATLPKHNIILNEFGLSDRNENDCIYYQKSQSFIINPTIGEDEDTGHRYSVRRLDDYVSENNIDHIDFLKIDAEGLDYTIMASGLEVIKNKVSFIQFEYWDGVKKCTDLLDTFDLYLMMEPQLLEAIKTQVFPFMTSAQKLIEYRNSLIPLTPDIIDLIDHALIPRGYGGNIFGMNKKKSSVAIEKLLFKI